MEFCGDPSPGLQTENFSLCAHMAAGASELSEISFIRALIPPTRALSYDPPMAAPPNAITPGVRFNHINLGGGTNIQSTVMCFKG